MMNYSANNSSNNVPEPGTFAYLVGAGLMGAGYALKKRFDFGEINSNF